MSINDYYQIDGMAINHKDDNDLILLINDDLNWKVADDLFHLQALQSKIHAYIGYIKSKQYNHAYPDQNFDKFTIDIHMNSHPSDAGVRFLDMVNRDLEKENIQVIVAIEEDTSYDDFNPSFGWGC